MENNSEHVYVYNETYGLLQRLGARIFRLNANGKEPPAGTSWKEGKSERPPFGSHNIGVSIPEGVVVIDVDSSEALSRIRKIPEWDENTLTVKTPRGWHFYWRVDNDMPQIVGSNPILGKGVDTRTGGRGYVVGPGSQIDGREYTVINRPDEIARIPEGLEAVLQERPVEEGIFKVEEGERNHQMARMAGGLFSTRATDDAILGVLKALNKLVFSPPLPDKEVRSIWNSIRKKRLTVGEAVFVEEYESTEDKVEACLKALGRKVRYNTRLNGIEVVVGETKWRAMEDAVEVTTISDIEKGCLTAPRLKGNGKMTPIKPIKFQRGTWRSYVLALAFRKQVDPFIEWLESLPEWDGVDRVEKLVCDCFKTDSPDVLIQWSIKSVMVGAIQRAYFPGYKHDEVVVLVGPQGIGKSTLWELLLPNRDWFGDGLNMAADDKGRVESLLGKVIVESSELRGTSRAEIDSLKAFLSRNTDHIRLAYGHYPVDIPRRAIIVGTTNDESCLPNDSTGNRRFVPIRVDGSKDNATKIREVMSDVDQLWAEALVRYHRKEPIYLKGALIEVQKQEAEEHRQRNQVLEERITKYLERRADGNGCAKVTISDMATALEMPNPNLTLQKEMCNIIKGLGGVKKQVRMQGTRKKFWVVEGLTPEKSEY